MTASQLQELLLTSLVRARGGDRRRWRIVIGAIRVYDPASHPHCNWSVAPSGDAGENEAVEALLDRVRLDHPRITRG